MCIKEYNLVLIFKPAHWKRSEIKLPHSFPFVESLKSNLEHPKKKFLSYFIQTNDIINKVKAHLE